MTILIDGKGNSIPRDHLPQQPQIAFGPLKSEEAGRERLSGSIIEGGHQTAGWVIRAEPPVRASIPQDHRALLGSSLPTFIMSPGPALSLGSNPRSPPKFPNHFPSQSDPFLLQELFPKMSIVESFILLLRYLQDSFLDNIGDAVVWTTAGIAMNEPLGSFFPDSFPDSLGLPVGNSHLSRRLS
jgi:hypothetical protein